MIARVFWNFLRFIFNWFFVPLFPRFFRLSFVVPNPIFYVFSFVHRNIFPRDSISHLFDLIESYLGAIRFSAVFALFSLRLSTSPFRIASVFISLRLLFPSIFSSSLYLSRFFPHVGDFFSGFLCFSVIIYCLSLNSGYNENRRWTWNDYKPHLSPSLWRRPCFRRAPSSPSSVPL